MSHKAQSFTVIKALRGVVGHSVNGCYAATFFCLQGYDVILNEDTAHQSQRRPAVSPQVIELTRFFWTTLSDSRCRSIDFHLSASLSSFQLVLNLGRAAAQASTTADL